jgi:hypothetical protein
MWARRFLIGLMLAVTALSALAFERPFPATAKRGAMTPVNYSEITMDGKARRLAANARIWNQDNTIDVATALRGSDLVVNYTENSAGEIDNVWILTKDEASKEPPQQPSK